ncbi:glycosyltransferase family 4 protein [Salinibacter ruber]|uniref:glycosyltransferase family 4 protein n=1 Tax=Salinibacter ruber TaxID=146919 RepID=UPI00216A5575|nr:glycosyltransferase family 4 protein [Salinibacter ruber]MCS3695715.1 glycosyltransferase involved in cell wall biosynthesis [Salinibacter ruber]
MADKVLLITEEFPPCVGGAGSVAFQNARELGRRIEVSVLTRRRKGTRELAIGEPFSVRLVQTAPKVWAFPFALKLRQLDLSFYDIIILNDIGAAYAAALALTDEELEKSIVYTHGAESEQILSSPTLRHRISGISFLYWRAIQKCNCIIAVSEFRKGQFVDTVGIDSIDQKTSVVYSGVDRSTFYPDSANIRGRHDIAGHTDILLSASRLVERKGYADMLEVFTELHRAGYSFHWIVAGDGPYRNTLLRNVEQAGMSPWVTWVGELSKDVLRTYYSSVDLFWLLSEFQEAFGLVYLEANACGTPVIGRELGGVSEAIDDGVNGFLVTNQAECKKILAKRYYRKIKRKDVLDWTNTFDVKATVHRLRTIINEMATSTEFSEKDI